METKITKFNDISFEEHYREYITCACDSPDHLMIMNLYYMVHNESEKDVFMTLDIHLPQLPSFWQRIMRAFYYVIGRKSPYGDFAEIIFQPHANSGSLDKIEKMIKLYKEKLKYAKR